MLNFNQLKLIIASYFLLTHKNFIMKKSYLLLSFLLFFIGSGLRAQTGNPSLINIDNLEELNAIRYDLDGNGTPSRGNESAYRTAFGLSAGVNTCTGGCQGYELKTDLDFNSTSSYTSGIINTAWTSAGSGAGWVPIGTTTSQFTATFEGNGKKISNLYINTSTLDYVGLFGKVRGGGEIRNLGIEGGSVTGGDRAYVGGLVGDNNRRPISACYSTGSVRGGNDSRVGGLVGYNDSGQISACYSTGSVTGGSGTSASVGGLVGYNNKGTIRACYSTGSVTGGNNSRVGGLVGYNNKGTIRACYSTGSVTGGNNSRVGGLVGYNTKGTIRACYSTGSVTGGNNSRVGGLVGYNSDGEISACYATGNATGTGDSARVGGLVGYNTGAVAKIIACYSTGSATGTGDYARVGGLVGQNDRGSIIACYSTGRVTIGSSPFVGGLVGFNSGTITDSYFDGATSGQGGTRSRSTTALQAPTGYTGIYSTWNVDIDGVSGVDDPWYFGTDKLYPKLKIDFDGNGTASATEFGVQRLYFTTASAGSEVPLGRPFSVAENSISGTLSFIKDLQVVEDASGTTTFSLSGGGTNFAISSSGELTVESGADLDFEDENSFLVDVSSSLSPTFTSQVRIIVTDVGDELVFADVRSERDVTFSKATGDADGTIAKYTLTKITTSLAIDNSIILTVEAGASVRTYSFVADHTGGSDATHTDLAIDDTSGEIRTKTVDISVEKTFYVKAVGNGGSLVAKVVLSVGVPPPLFVEPESADDDVTFTSAMDVTKATYEVEKSLADVNSSGDKVLALNVILSSSPTYAYVDGVGTSVSNPTGLADITSGGVIKTSSALALKITPMVFYVKATQGGTSVVAKVELSVGNSRLIDITNLDQLHAIRWDLNGDGTPSRGNENAYRTAFGLSAGVNNTCTGGCQGYELKTDLDFNSTSSYASGIITTAWTSAGSGAGWVPIGTTTSQFTATFEGNGKKISKLYINTSTLVRVGLFGAVGSGGEIRNLGIEGGSATGGRVFANVGGLVGYNGGTIRACYATGSATGGRVFANVGGLVGYNNSGTISACYATGSATGEARVYAGGLVGANSGTISACYSTGSVTGGNNSTVGGLVGFNAGSSAKIIACYSTGRATGGTSASVGGLVGVNTETISASYFDTTTSGRSGSGGKTTAQLQYPTDYPEDDAASGGMAIYSTWNVDVSGTTTTVTMDDPWDFGANNRYPKLKVDFDRDGTATAVEFGRQHFYFINTSDVEVFSLSVAENMTSGTIGHAKELSGMGTPSFSLTMTDANFSINSSTGEISVKSGADLDFEDDAKNSFVLPIVATVGSFSVDLRLSIKVTDVDEVAPVFDPATYAFDVDDGSVAGTAVDSVSATDAVSSTLTYGLTGNNHTDFTIDAMGQITVSTGVTLSHSTRPTYSLMVTATDGAGNVATTTVTITVLPDTTMPVFDETTYAFEVDDGSVAGTAVGSVSARDASTLTYSLTGDGHADFTIDAMGAITVSAAVTLAGSTRLRYNLMVTATDGAGNVATTTVTITVVPDTTMPVFDETTYAFDVDDGSVAGTAVGSVSARDASTLTYSLTGDGHADFTIDAMGQITVSSGVSLSQSRKSTYRLTVTATDAAMNEASAAVTIIVISGLPPSFTFPSGASSFAFDVAENAIVGAVVGTVTATGDVLTYRLRGMNRTDFTIDSVGVVKVSDPSRLDRAAKPSYMLSVTVRDRRDNAITAEVNITVAEIDTTPPRFTFPSGEISFVFGIADGSVAATVVGTITATDDVSSTLTYSLAGNNHTDFTIDAMGAITVSTGVTLSLATRPRYALRVKATDGAGNVSLPANVTITVIDLAVFGVAAEKARVLGLYPNPASGRVYVSGLEPRSRYLYELYSLWGERVSTGQLSEARSIDLEEISVGIYVLVLRSEDGEELLRSRCLVK